MRDIAKILLTKERAVQRYINITRNSCIFLHNNDCEKPYIDIYIDLLLIT